MIEHTTDLRVRYKETDAMGIVYHGNYFTWFEVGRVRLLDAAGFPYRALNEMGYHLPVLEAHANYKASAKFDDEIAITAFIREMPRVRIKIEYEVKRGDTLLVTGHTQHAFIDNSGAAVKPPPEFMAKLKESF